MASGASLSGPHPTIANLNVILTDLASNSSLILLASCTGTLDTTASTYQKGCIMYATDVATGSSGTYVNTGTSTTPVWNKVGTTGLAGGTYYIEGINGGSNAVQGSLFSSGTTKVALVTGLIVALKLNQTLQAGSNTFNLNGTVQNIKKCNIPTVDIQTTYAVGSVILLAHTPGVNGGVWQCLGPVGGR